MKKKIALLVESPFSKRDYERFGVDVLRKYFDVEVFDFTPWINPRVWERLSDVVHPFDGYHPLSSFIEFENKLRKQELKLVIDYLSPNRLKSSRVHKKLKNCSVQRVIFANGLLPPLPRMTHLQRLTTLRYRTHKLRVLALWVRRFCSQYVTNEIAPDVIVMTGSVSTDIAGAGTATQIWAHSFDYDLYLNLRKEQAHSSKSYAVYIDEDCAFHSDFSHNHIKPLVTAENFYPALMRYFAEFEKATGLDIVIAAHPRSQWHLRPDLLEDRAAVKGKTASLIADAKLVFSHASTSIGFAALFRVPLVFLTSHEMNDSIYRDEVSVRSRLFNVPLINIDCPTKDHFDLDVLAKIDQRAYDGYVEQYIKKSGSPDTPSWEIFAASIFKAQE